MFGELANGGSAPVLEAVMRFAGARQKVLAHNVANITTPNFQAKDVSVSGFQAQLRDAIERRKEKGPGTSLRLESTAEVEQSESGDLRVEAKTQIDGILGHDRNVRNLETTMQAVVENATAFRVATDLLRSRYQLLSAAISERA